MLRTAFERFLFGARFLLTPLYAILAVSLVALLAMWLYVVVHLVIR